MDQTVVQKAAAWNQSVKQAGLADERDVLSRAVHVLKSPTLLIVD